MTLPFKEVGFFTELSGTEPVHGSIHAAVLTAPHPDQQRILEYLENGSCWVATGYVYDDVIRPENGPVLYGGLVTDGEWQWRTDLSYYVKKYHLRLPEDFVAHMRARNWSPAKLSEDELIEVCKWYSPDRKR